MANTPVDNTALFMVTMDRLLLEGGPTPEHMVLPERLDRSRLDFSLESVQVIDEYLLAVHEHGQSSAGASLLTTIWVASLYVGETIRRAARHRRFEWVTMDDGSPASGGTTTGQVDLASLQALRAEDGELCLPSRAVLRAILRGLKARTVHSFARGAIESVSNAAMAAASARDRRSWAAFA